MLIKVMHGAMTKLTSPGTSLMERLPSGSSVILTLLGGNVDSIITGFSTARSGDSARDWELGRSQNLNVDTTCA